MAKIKKKVQPAPPRHRSRYVETVMVQASSLVPSNLNWKTHPEQQRTLVDAAMQEIGIADVLIARRNEAGELELIDGHLRQDILGDTEVPVAVFDLTEAEGNKLMLVLDPLAGLAEPNAQDMDALLRTIEISNQDLSGFVTQMAEDAGVVPKQWDSPEPAAGKPRPAKEHTCPMCGHVYVVTA